MTTAPNPHASLRVTLPGIAICLLAVACERSPAPADSDGAPFSVLPNLLLISIDTLRADRLSLYGYSRPTSPRLDQVAAESIVFDRFYYNGGGTLPSHMSLFTALHPATHGIGPESAKTLEPERLTLTEALRARGYATAAFTDGGWIAGKFGFAQGFDEYHETGGGFAASVPKAEAWLAGRAPDRPFFLFLHSYDVHSSWKSLPYDCPGEAELDFAGHPPEGFNGCKRGLCASTLLADSNARVQAGAARLDDLFSPAELRYISDLYDGCVRWTDARLGDFFDGLRGEGLWENTLVVILSDHGEEFGEHGALLHDQGGYEELARIPLLIKPVGPRRAERRVDGLAAMVDVMPTVLDLLGSSAPPEVQGSSLVPAIAERRTRRPNVHMYSVLRDGRFKYFSDERRIFDLAADPGEHANLFAGRPDLAAGLERTVRDLIAVDHAAALDFSRRNPLAPPATLSEEEAARLRSLGYVR